MIKKSKKISIKPFLNTYLEPVGHILIGPGKDLPLHSLYYKVTFNRKSTQLKSIYALGFADLDDEEARKIIPFESNILRNIIEYEISLSHQVDYSLAGLKNKYQVYGLSVMNTLDNYLRKKIYFSAAKTKNIWYALIDFKSASIAISALDYYDMCNKLFPNFKQCQDSDFAEELESFKSYHKIYFKAHFQYEFPTIIEWKNGSHLKESKLWLTEIVKNPKKVEKYIAIIDRIINDRLKNVIDD